MAKLLKTAVEEGTFVITMSFTDEAEQIVTPNELYWTLMDRNGNIMNHREEVQILIPTSTYELVLQDDDLVIPDPAVLERIFLIRGTYDSDLGNNLPLRETATFSIKELYERDEWLPPQMINLDEVKSLLQISTADTTKDNTIRDLIPIVQDFVKEHCENNFEVIGTALPKRDCIAFENDAPSFIRDYSARLTEYQFDTYLKNRSLTLSTLSFVHNTSAFDEIKDSAQSLLDAGFKVNMIISILDSTSNNSYFKILSITNSDDYDIIKTDGTVVDEVAGKNITITRGIDVRVSGSLRNDGLWNIKKVENTKLILRDDLVLAEELTGRVIKIEVINEIKYPQGIKLPVANLISFHLYQKSPGIESEKLGDYSVNYRMNYPNSLLIALNTWKKSKLKIGTTTDRFPFLDEELYDTDWPNVNR